MPIKDGKKGDVLRTDFLRASLEKRAQIRQVEEDDPVAL